MQEDLKEQLNELESEHKRLQKDYIFACRENKSLKIILTAITTKLTRQQKLFLETQMFLYGVNI